MHFSKTGQVRVVTHYLVRNGSDPTVLSVVGCQNGRHGTPGFRAPNTAHNFEECQAADIWAFGVIVMLAVSPMGRSVQECEEYERKLYQAVESRHFPTFLAHVLDQLGQCHAPQQSPTRKILLQIAKIESGGVDEESDPELLVQRSSVWNLLQLAFKLLHPQPDLRLKLRDVFLSRFVRSYLADSPELQRQLLLEGLLVPGRRFPNGKTLNPSLLVLLPGLGLEVFALVDTAEGDLAGGYSGTLQARTVGNSADCASKFSFHTLCGDAWELGGSPGPDRKLLAMVSASAVGSLFASSRVRPDVASSGNVSRVDRLTRPAEVLPDSSVDGESMGVVWMRARTFINWGTKYDWDYNWATLAGGHKLSPEEIEEMIRAQGRPLPDYVKEMIQRRRQEVLGQYPDAPRPAGELCPVEF